MCYGPLWQNIGLVFRPKVVGSIATVAMHIFQACPVWIYTQSNITNILINKVLYIKKNSTNRQEKVFFCSSDYQMTRVSFSCKEQTAAQGQQVCCHHNMLNTYTREHEA